jgi:phosphoserine aminotransferase
MALGNFISNDRDTEVLHWDAFGAEWLRDGCGLQQQGQQQRRVIEHTAAYGDLPDLSRVKWGENDVVFVFNGTTSGVCVGAGELRALVPSKRDGVIICDATSAVFAMEVPWPRAPGSAWT